MEIVTIHPEFIVGPSLIKERHSSADGIAKMMMREIPGIPFLILPSVDIRDVARAHYLALITPEIQGQRFITINHSINL